MTTNITVTMLTKDEAENIIPALESVAPIMDELVLTDASDDDTVPLAASFCTERGIDFGVVESTEREYLLEGPGTQRRRATDRASNDYVMAMGCDVRVELLDEEWFHQEFRHDVYSHTRVKPSGRVERDYRLFKPYPGWYDTNDDRPRWRGIIHEEIQNKRGIHVCEKSMAVEAPMIHHQQRYGAMDAASAYSEFHRKHHEAYGANTGKSLKKQHYLLHRSLAAPRQRTYTQQVYRDYYRENYEMILEHWNEIRREYDLPQFAWDETENPANFGSEVARFTENPGEPSGQYRNLSASGYAKQKLSEYVVDSR